MSKSTMYAETNYEKLQHDAKAIKMIDVRRQVLNLITNDQGLVSWSKAKALGDTMPSTLGAQTVQKFALGETVRPSHWTYRQLAQHVTGLTKSAVWILPEGYKPPEGVPAVRID